LELHERLGCIGETAWYSYVKLIISKDTIISSPLAQAQWKSSATEIKNNKFTVLVIKSSLDPEPPAFENDIHGRAFFERLETQYSLSWFWISESRSMYLRNS
jgi:hypothetical protein